MTIPDAPPPSRSNAVVERTEERVRIRFPAPGLLGTPLAMLSLMFGAMLGFTGYNLVKAGAEHPGYHTSGIVCLIVAAGLLLVGVTLGRRVIELERSEGEILLRSRSILGGWTRRWPLAEVERVAVVETGWTQGGAGRRRMDVYRLEIKPRNEPPMKLLAGRPQEELKWLATVLTGKEEEAPSAAGESA